MVCMVRCSGAALGMPCFFAVGLHNARGTQGLHLVRLHNIHNASGSSYAQPQHNKARLDRDARVLRAGAVQIMQDPGRSRALGKSSTRREPSLASLPPSGSTLAAPTRSRALGAALLRIGDDESVKKGMDPTP